MFDGKYQKTVNTYDQCWGFVKGVEAVLRHAIGSVYKGSQETTAAAANDAVELPTQIPPLRRSRKIPEFGCATMEFAFSLS